MAEVKMPDDKYIDQNLTSKQRVLFFDDDRVTQELVKSSLEDDFEVICETSGAMAIDSAEAAQPHLILLDLSMPNVDGFEVLKRLKSHPIFSAIPIICVSGKKDELSRSRAYNLGAAGFMSKPIDVNQMSSDIKALVKSMNMEFSSSDGRKSIFRGFNTSSMMSRLKSDLKAKLESNLKVVVFSFQEGARFFDLSYLENAVQEESLFFLQIKPNLITRLPYLEDLSPIVSDIEQLLSVPSESTVLFFERPELLVEISAQERLVATTMLLGETLSKNFKAVHYYSVSSSDPSISASLNSMAKILIGESSSNIRAG